MLSGLNFDFCPSDDYLSLILYHPQITRDTFNVSGSSSMSDSNRKKKASNLQTSNEAKPVVSDTKHSTSSTSSTSSTAVAEDLNLENSLEKHFTLARQRAYNCVTRTLDPLRPTYKSTSTQCPFRSHVLWRGNPVQEKLLNSCRSYTIQWLSERDTSCWTNSDATIPTSSSKGVNFVMKEPELVKNIGAWSADLACARAKDALLSSSKVDTVPGSPMGLVDAKLSVLQDNQTKSLNVVEITNGKDETDKAQDAYGTYEIGTDPCQVLGSQTIEVKDQSIISESSDEASTESDANFIGEPVEIILPCIIGSIRTHLGGYREAPAATGPYSANERSARSSKSQGSSAGQRNGQDGQDGPRRKRLRESNDNDDEDSEDNEKSSAQRGPNPMPLQDPSAKLACHYHVFDPSKYAESTQDGKKYKRCAMGFKDSKELRDHHKKKHYGPKYFCSRCHRDFDDSVLKAQHEILPERCDANESDPFPHEHYILIGTARRVAFEKMKKPRHISHEDHWFDVWNTLFPGYPFPTTPYTRNDYLDATLSRIAEDEIQNFLQIESYRYLADDIRELVNRIRQRLCVELGSGRHSPAESVSAPAGNARQAEASQNLVMAMPAHAGLQDNTTLPSINPNFLSPRPPTAMPAHAYYSAQGWQNYSGSDVPSVGSQNPDFISQGSSHNGPDSSFDGYDDQGFSNFPFSLDLDVNHNNDMSFQ